MVLDLLGNDVAFETEAFAETVSENGESQAQPADGVKLPTGESLVDAARMTAIKVPLSIARANIHGARRYSGRPLKSWSSCYRRRPEFGGSDHSAAAEGESHVVILSPQ